MLVYLHKLMVSQTFFDSAYEHAEPPAAFDEQLNAKVREYPENDTIILIRETEPICTDGSQVSSYQEQL